MSELTFTAFCTPIPQGSMKAFVRGNRAMITSDNARLKPYRHTVAQVAALEMAAQGLQLPYAGKHEPVEVVLCFVLAKPGSVAKKRIWPAVKPDVDKLERATFDALKGIAWVDDGQPCIVSKRKVYGMPERVEVTVRKITGIMEAK